MTNLSPSAFYCSPDSPEAAYEEVVQLCNGKISASLPSLLKDAISRLRHPHTELFRLDSRKQNCLHLLAQNRSYTHRLKPRISVTGRIAAFEILLTYASHSVVNQRDINGSTPLHLVCDCECYCYEVRENVYSYKRVKSCIVGHHTPCIVAMLLAYGARINIKDNDGYLPRDYIQSPSCDNSFLVRSLIASEYDVDKENLDHNRQKVPSNSNSQFLLVRSEHQSTIH